MIPIENSVAGRVADIHHLLPASGLFIVGEWFLPVRHQLMAVRGAKLRRHQDAWRATSTRSASAAASSASSASSRSSRADTAGSARDVSERKDKTVAAIASRLAARHLRPRYPGRGRRGRGPQHHPLRGAGARAEMGRAGLGAAGHDFCFPGAQPARRALQGARRLSPPTAST